MKAGQVIKHLHLKPNSILLIKAGCSIANKDSINKLVDAINKAGIRGIALVVVNDLDDVKKLDEKEMVKLGWIKVEKAVNYPLLRRGLEP